MEFLSTRLPPSILYQVLQYAPCHVLPAHVILKSSCSIRHPYDTYTYLGGERFYIHSSVRIHAGRNDHMWYRVGYRVTRDGKGYYVNSELFVSGDGKTFRTYKGRHYYIPWRRQ